LNLEVLDDPGQAHRLLLAEAEAPLHHLTRPSAVLLLELHAVGPLPATSLPTALLRLERRGGQE